VKVGHRARVEVRGGSLGRLSGGSSGGMPARRRVEMSEGNRDIGVLSFCAIIASRVVSVRDSLRSGIQSRSDVIPFRAPTCGTPRVSRRSSVVEPP
jgi:hypothetical protein